jgi:hypothetical protein
MDCSAMIFVDKFFDFSTFFVLLLALGRPELRHLQVTLNWP